MGCPPGKREQSSLPSREEQHSSSLSLGKRSASYLTEKTAAEKEQAFLAAIAQERDLYLAPSIRDMERFAPEWAALVPSDDRQRAALARKLADKHRFRSRDVPAIRKALGLDVDGVRQAFAGLFQRPIDSIYATAVSPSEQILWCTSRLANRLERLPPFWTAFSLTLTETVGASVLALPIALSGVGPLAGLALMIILGLVNILTLVGVVEAITRNGNMRYGTAYFGRLVGDYLGKPGSLALAPALLFLNIATLLAYYIGISVSLADMTNVSALLWSALIFLIAVLFLRRETLNATVASALVIGIVNILILLGLSLLAFRQFQPANLQIANVRMGGGQLFDPGTLELVFGVVLFAFFGHTSAGNAAKVVLRRDPGGKSLIWGNVTAMAVAIVLYCLWVIAVSGAISPSELERVTGTALSALALKIGGPVPILGITYVVLAMGIGSVHISYGLYYQVREALPRRIRKRTQAWVGLAPIMALFMIVEWMLFTGRESFSWLLCILGVLLLPLLGGIFPVLMLVESRRKGDHVPQLAFGFLGSPLVMGVVYLIYLGSLFAYGLFIWDDPLHQCLALAMGLVVLLVTYLAVRQGSFATRTVVELKVEMSARGERATLAIVERGRPVVGAIQAMYANTAKHLSGERIEIPTYRQVKRIVIKLPSSSSSEMKVWLHRVTNSGDSEPLSATLTISTDSNVEVIQVDNSGQVMLALQSRITGLEITLT